MKLRKLFGLQTAQEKLEEYKALKEELIESDKIGMELTDKFMFQKSIMDDINTLPESTQKEVYDKYNEFIKIHSKEVGAACARRNKILKSLARLRKDEDIAEACLDVDLVENTTKAYKAGRLNKSLYFNIIKSVTGEPTKYADVIAVNKDGKILILHRVEDYVPTGKVCLPGGHVDPGEDFVDAALRELKEETNLDPIPNSPIEFLGQYEDKDAYIKYYKVMVDELQPVTCDATEHCFSEFINIGEIPLKPFIFDQGEIALNFLMNPAQLKASDSILKALKAGRITPECFVPSFTQIIKKALDTEKEEPIMPESMEGAKKSKKVKFTVRDTVKNVESIMKAVSGCKSVTAGTELMFENPVVILSMDYESDPTSGLLTEAEVEFTGDNHDMKTLLKEIKMGLRRGGMKIKTPHEEFMIVNENGIDYVGDPVFVES